MASLLTPSALLANLNLSSEVAGPIQHDNHAPFLIEQNHLNSVLSHITTLPVSDPTPLDKLYIDIKPDVVARIEQISHILLSLPPKAPLYISIAPQCGGKTTALRKSLPSGNSTIDVTIDDQPGIYVPVSPTEFISGDAGNPRNALPVCGKILKRRLVDPSLPEQRFVLKRLVGELTTKEFRDSIFKLRMSKILKNALVESVENFLRNKPASFEMSPTVDLFVLDEIFKSGIESAKAALSKAATETPAVPCSWGNTNAKSSDFEFALQTAELSKRPVFFLNWGGDYLPNVGLEELMSRNINRFAMTGRYIPAFAIDITKKRCEELLANSCKVASVWDGKNLVDFQGVGFEVDKKLASSCGFFMGDDRLVTKKKKKQL